MADNWIWVAVMDGQPIATAHHQKDIEHMLDVYCGVPDNLSERLRYEPYDSKYPSVNDLEGIYYYKDVNNPNEYQIKLYGVEYKKHKI